MAARSADFTTKLKPSTVFSYICYSYIFFILFLFAIYCTRYVGRVLVCWSRGSPTCSPTIHLTDNEEPYGPSCQVIKNECKAHTHNKMENRLYALDIYEGKKGNCHRQSLVQGVPLI